MEVMLCIALPSSSLLRRVTLPSWDMAAKGRQVMMDVQPRAHEAAASSVASGTSTVRKRKLACVAMAINAMESWRPIIGCWTLSIQSSQLLPGFELNPPLLHLKLTDPKEIVGHAPMDRPVRFGKPDPP